MAKKKQRLEDDISGIFAHWGISSRAREELAERFGQETETPPESPETIPEESKQRALRPSKTEGQKLRVKNRGSKIEGQRRDRKTNRAGIPPSDRTFKNRPKPGAATDPFVVKDSIPKRHFFLYYNALHDVVLPQVNRKSRMLLCSLFRRSHGYNRNWCQVNFRELERATGATSNTLREAMKLLVEEGWVHIVSDGYHEATTYGLRIPVDLEDEDEGKGEEEEEDSDLPAQKAEQPAADSDPEKLRVKNRGLKIEGQKMPLKNRPSNSDTGPAEIDSQKLRACTDSTCTGHVTVQKPVSHPEVHPHSVPHTNESAREGENRVYGNLALKVYPQGEESQPNANAGLGSYLTPQEESYIQTLSSREQTEIYDAQDAWDEILGAESRPAASKLNAMLEHIRPLGYKNDTLDEKFRECLEKTKRKQPKDNVAWLMAAFKGARYP